MNRTRHSIQNSIWGILFRLLHMVFPVLFRAIIIRQIGAEYVGLNGLFKSILEVLNLSELGFGSAVVYMMYKPVAEDDKVTINRLLALLRKIYRLIGLIMLIVGVALIPFLNFLVKNDTGADVNIYLLYGMYLFHTVMSYWMYAYRSSLFTAYQEYEVSYKIEVACWVVLYLLQFVVLMTTKNYYLSLAVSALMIIPQNLLYKVVSERRYPGLRCEGTPTKEEIDTIKTKIGALFGHRIGNTVIFSIDSIIISAFIGISILTKYDNYNYILAAVVTLITVFRTSLLASVGNKLVTDSMDNCYSLFKWLTFLWLGLVAWCSTCLISLYQPFISICFGEEYLFPIGIVACISLYFYVWQFRQIGLVFKDAAGLWERDKLKPYIGMTLNAVFSILFVKVTHSILGVLIPTMAVLILMYYPWENRVLFKYLFKRSSREYALLASRFILTSLAAMALTFLLNQSIPLSGIPAILVRGIVCVAVMPALYLLLNLGTDQSRAALGLAKKGLKLAKNMLGRR